MDKNYLSPMRFIILLIIMLFLLTGCRKEEKSYELTNYMGDTVEVFEGQTKAELIQMEEGIYKAGDFLQLIAPKGDIKAIKLTAKADGYTISGISIGMKKTEVDSLLLEAYGKEITKTITADNKAIMYSYAKKLNELSISYDINTDEVIEIAYYDLQTDEEEKVVEEEVNNGELVAMVGDIKVYYNEAMVYLKSAQDNYESIYGKGVWDVDIYGDGRSFEQVIKEEVIKQITELKVICDKAKDYELELDEDGLASSINYAVEHFEGMSDKDIDKYLITRQLLERIYADNLLAEKMFETLTINVDTNVSEMDARQITVQHILIYSTELDDAGNRIPMSLEDKEAAYIKATALLEKAKTTEDFYTLAQENSQAEDIEFTFGRGKGPAEYNSSFELAAFTLKTGETSELISTDYGWHILYCVTDYDEGATTRVKEDIIEERRNNMFASLYEEWSVDYDVVVNSEIWNSITLKSE